MASTVWAARVDPTTPTRLEVQQFDSSGTELESFYVTGVTDCNALLASSGTVVAITEAAFYTYDGATVSTFTLPTGSYAGIYDFAINDSKFGVVVKHPTVIRRGRYYESADGVSWTLLTSGSDLYGYYLLYYRYRPSESRYLIARRENNEVPDTTLEWTTNHVDFTSITKYYDGTYYLGPTGLLIDGTELYYGPMPGYDYTGSAPSYVVEMTGSTSPTARALTGVPSGYDAVRGGIFAIYDYDGSVAALVAESPTGGGDYVYGVYRKSGTTFARHRTYTTPDNLNQPNLWYPVIDNTVKATTLYITNEGGVNGSFRIYEGGSYVTVSGDATYPWLAATIDSDSAPTDNFWVEEDDCVESAYVY